MNTLSSQSLSINDMASFIGGAGIADLSTDLKVSLLLIGTAVVLKIAVAVLTKYNIPVTTVANG